MMLLLTPCKSEAGRAKMSLFLVRISSSSFSSLGERLAPMVTLLSGHASSRCTEFVSSSSLRFACPLGMSRGSEVPPLLDWTELIDISLCFVDVSFYISCLFLTAMNCDYAMEGWHFHA